MTALSVEVVTAVRATLGEGPSWDSRIGRLLWVDIPAGEVHMTDPVSGAERTIGLGQPVGAVVANEGGGWAVAVRDGFGRLDESGVMDLVHDLRRDGLRMNDGKCSPDGSFWAGTMADDAIGAVGTLYRMPPGWAIPEVALEGLTISNGLAWSRDGASMYFIDSPTRRVDRFDLEPGTWKMSNRRPQVVVSVGSGNPDGMAIDDAGCLWVALAGSGRVQRYRPDGTPDISVELPVRQVTSCCFGGERGDILFITTGRRAVSPDDTVAGAVFACYPKVTGPVSVAYDGK